MTEFAGMQALVTGAGRGIGKAVALNLAAEGARVVVSDIDGASAADVAAEIGARGGDASAVRCDVTDKEEVEAAVALAAPTGSLDLLVGNVGVALETDFEDLTVEEWDHQLTTSLTGSFLLCQAAATPLRAARAGGRAVLIGSVNGLRAYGHEAYSAAKAGLVSLTQNLALRLGPDGVRVNMVAPATIVTEAWTPRAEADPELLSRLARNYPSGELGTPDDVAHAVTFLLSDRARWINGVVLPVDGGLLAGSLDLLRDRQVRDADGGRG